MFGATVLIPTLFGAAASAYAASLITAQPLLIVAIALLWAFIVLTIDRAFLAAYRHCLPKYQKRLQFCLRFTIAMLMGITVAHPLVLLLFESGVDEQIRTSHQAKQDQLQKSLNTKFEEIDIIISEQLELQSKLRQEYRNSFDRLAPKQDFSNSSFATQITVIEHQIKIQIDEIELLDNEISEWKLAYEEEISGHGISGKPGVGPEARRIQDEEITRRQIEKAELSQSVSDLRADKLKIIEHTKDSASEIAQAEARTQISELDAMAESRAILRADLKDQLDATAKEIQRLRHSKTAIQSQNILPPPQKDLIKRTLALHQLFHQKGGSVAMVTYVILSLLFVTLDTIPIVVKFTNQPGPYDFLIKHQEKNFLTESHLDEESVEDCPDESPPPPTRVHPKWKVNQAGRKRVRDYWNRPRELTYQQPVSLEYSTLPPEALESHSEDKLVEHHILTKANALAEMRQVFESNKELARSVGITPSCLSKYFKLLKTPESTQAEMMRIPELSLESAYRIACLESIHHKTLLESAQSCSQKELRQKIIELKQAAAV